MSDTPLPGPLEDFLHEPPVPPDAWPLRAAIFVQTSNVLRRRRRLRLALVMTGAAAAVVLAALAWRAGLPSVKTDAPVVPESVTDRRPAPGAAPTPSLVKKAPAPTPAMRTPLEQEWAAFDALPQQRARLYFQTGDRYLNECQDIESALRCYQQALLVCQAGDLAFDPSDNWLVMALKQDHRKER